MLNQKNCWVASLQKKQMMGEGAIDATLQNFINKHTVD
jgi:hypothetical protein